MKCYSKRRVTIDLDTIVDSRVRGRELNLTNEQGRSVKEGKEEGLSLWGEVVMLRDT